MMSGGGEGTSAAEAAAAAQAAVEAVEAAGALLPGLMDAAASEEGTPAMV